MTPPIERENLIAGMFGRVAPWYDFLNHLLSMGIDFYWRKKMVEALGPMHGGTILDLAAGTLDSSIEVLKRNPGAKVVAADLALPMLKIGQKKIKGPYQGRLECTLADGRYLPFRDNVFDGVVIAFGIRNIRPRNNAFEEIYRVLKPGGTLCVLEFGTGKRKVWRGIYNFYLKYPLPFIGKIVSGDAGAYRYLADTIRNFPDEELLAEEIALAGFDHVEFSSLTSGIVYIHTGIKPDV